ncbi:hypothetical protein B9Q01_02115 [Candidatus Marsarchaeota G1 archaeon OSP_D]|jgi:uncharacterized OsmC-like protein|uniref:Osmotically inducible protein OsmC n=3 Tax=Candidatus Marsarchaeota group 1 TaxID=2203770 RepID=A0A2R6AJU4_9ARCH|nr:MAG: hypothetical protein B9Q01_02115 [Candidatus Marsarchaeota G1 archaeon OSP_D]PSN86641.1 MAG: hypothetical protein B9Q02_01375 [Candidatus Marsarchaeota G1 archaeon BE_D]PSN89088.1 MAG: hypothetical protein B9Q00_02895 [Candidatus Marsarchaeota G1 archaeon OSP_C]
MVEGTPKVTVELLHDYVFKVSFSGTEATLIMDEPEPLGKLEGPNASRVLAAAVGNCLSASLAFCLRKAKIEVKSIKTEVEPIVERNEKGYWRVKRLNVKISAQTSDSSNDPRIKRCLEIFENYCVVTGAVREGIEVNVNVETS